MEISERKEMRTKLIISMKLSWSTFRSISRKRGLW